MPAPREAAPQAGSISVTSQKNQFGVSLTMAEIDDQEMLKMRLEYLKTEHGDLDRAIDALIESGNYNTLQLQRLKKRKLVLKDQIFATKNSLLPDIIA
ncbi:YdcH family protein [Sneathiella sp.]|uniref:YdcH family protein n=1 Tax=Sneathiella sp. TaxID=1964365 RepID=UPI003565E607